MTRRSLRNNLFWATAIGLVMIAMLMALVVSLWGLETLNRGVEQLKPMFLVWRTLVFVTLIGGWPVWISAALDRHWITPEKSIELSAFRWPFAIWLLLLEGLLNQGLLLKLVNLIVEIS
ncbi:MAG TPA: hypothetical protein ENJ32_05490 [Crenotrichaceae bacterium]|nr:hypothetical protein [Crenotrichaceae bacterium]